MTDSGVKNDLQWRRSWGSFRRSISRDLQEQTLDSGPNIWRFVCDATRLGNIKESSTPGPS